MATPPRRRHGLEPWLEYASISQRPATSETILVRSGVADLVAPMYSDATCARQQPDTSDSASRDGQRCALRMSAASHQGHHQRATRTARAPVSVTGPSQMMRGSNPAQRQWPLSCHCADTAAALLSMCGSESHLQRLVTAATARRVKWDGSAGCGRTCRLQLSPSAASQQRVCATPARSPHKGQNPVRICYQRDNLGLFGFRPVRFQ